MNWTYIILGVIGVVVVAVVVIAHYRGSRPHDGESKRDLWRWF